MAKKTKNPNQKRNKKKDVSKADAEIKGKLGAGGLGLAKKAAPTNRLPQKLLNMQFMRSAEEKRTEEAHQEERAHLEDSSRWFLKKTLSIKPSIKNKIRSTIGFAEIIADDNIVSGRRVFGDIHKKNKSIEEQKEDAKGEGEGEEEDEEAEKLLASFIRGDFDAGETQNEQDDSGSNESTKKPKKPKKPKTKKKKVEKAKA